MVDRGRTFLPGSSTWDDHCLLKWATSLMLVESTGELTQTLVHHLMRAPESHQTTLVLGWTPLPLGNQPTTLVQNQSAHITTSFGLS